MTTQPAAPRPRKQRSDGERTRAAILDAAMRLASVEGIEGLTLGRLAAELGVSKSGLYAHFGSKEQLQLETIDAALEVFGREVIAPAHEVREGLPRLEAMVAAYFSYLERWVFPGGCFFGSLLAEMDARPGSVHEKVLDVERAWLAEFREYVAGAQRLGELDADADVEQLVFELYACMELANYHFVLFRDPAVLERGRRAVDRILDHAAFRS
ncbi:MAG TPA: TetR family transcriptional regulator [Longimicrobiales bacterium]|nr:TetR family transcriptional regulator [Longimicrobiales bacterium]